MEIIFTRESYRKQLWRTALIVRPQVIAHSTVAWLAGLCVLFGAIAGFPAILAPGENSCSTCVARNISSELQSLEPERTLREEFRVLSRARKASPTYARWRLFPKSQGEVRLGSEVRVVRARAPVLLETRIETQLRA